MKDLTILFLTANEVPEAWRTFHLEVLMKAARNYPMISLSRKPMDLGLNILDTGPKSYYNIYKMMLAGAKAAKTDYIAVAEDDVLYPPEHFDFYRPEHDTFAYNQNRFALFTWSEPVYSMRIRKSNCTLIAPRKLAIEALEERFLKHPDPLPNNMIGELGRERAERLLDVIPRKAVEVYSNVSVIQFNHPAASEDRQSRKHKSLGPIRAYDIPHWGPAKELVKRYI